MTRLEKKCFVAASGTHALLFLILLVGPAFFVAKDRVQPVQQISVISGKVVDDALSSGGSTVAQPPPPPPQQQITQPPAPQPHAEPPKADPKPPEPEKHEPKPDKSLEPATKPKIHQTELDPSELKRIHKPSSTVAKNIPPKNTPTTDDTRAQDVANQRRIADQLKQTIRGLGQNLGKPVSVEMRGSGADGPAMTNYKDIVYSRYYNAWAQPSNSEQESPKVVVTIIIARTGKVVDSRITRRSGNSVMDRSIENLLENVTFVEPFPDESKNQQLSFTLTFGLAGKTSETDEQKLHS